MLLGAAAWLAGPAPAQAPIPPADLLTDRSDDGSLVAGLSHADPHARAVAARGLARLRAPAEASLALLQRAHAEDDEAVLCELLFALGQRRVADAAGLLTGLLGPQGHASPRVRAAACDALGRLGDDAHSLPLVVRLDDNEALVRGAAALALFRLDGRRYTHERSASEALLARRDEALGRHALEDPDPGARWRVAYALAGVRGRRGFATVLQLALRDDEPLLRLFALRGLAALQAESLGTPIDPRPLFRDPDERVIVEAARAAATLGDAEELAPALASLLAHPSGLVRASAAESLAARLPALDDDARLLASEALAAVGRRDASPMVRRAACAALALHADEGRALFCLHELARGPDRRDRERAATLLREGPWRDTQTLRALLADPAPLVSGAALGALLARDPAGAPLFDLPAQDAVDALLAALSAPDPALRTQAAEAVLPQGEDGTLDPRVLHACAVSLLSATGPEMKEAAQMLRRVLGLPPDAAPPGAAPTGRLLERLLARDAQAAADPHPRVRLATSRGEVVLELDRAIAPAHVGSFLELAQRGCYDGLDFHRVVPNFVVQGLDPRGDGWGTGGRRLPDEFSPQPYLAGAVGMPNAGEPDTGGCQLFFTHVPTPHLDGHYTWFGRVVAGLDVVQRLEIGDRVERVTRE